jgi:hypothetical protein
MKKTSLLRHAFVEVPAVSVVKIEMIEKSVLHSTMSSCSRFHGWKLYDKKFIFVIPSMKQGRRSAYFIC